MGPLYQLSFIRKRDHQQQERSEEGRPSEREVGMQQQEVEQTGGGDGGGGGGGWDDNTSPDSEDKWYVKCVYNYQYFVIFQVIITTDLEHYN